MNLDDDDVAIVVMTSPGGVCRSLSFPKLGLRSIEKDERSSERQL